MFYKEVEAACAEIQNGNLSSERQCPQGDRGENGKTTELVNNPRAGRQLAVAMHLLGVRPIPGVALPLASELPSKPIMKRRMAVMTATALASLSMWPMNNNNNISNNKVTNNNDENNKYSWLVNYLVDTVLSIFYGLPHFILTRTR